MTAAVHVYCGPTITAAAASAILPAAVVHPPARHGDLLAAALRPGDTVLIIDGVFHQAAPVRHKEILHLIASGVQVAGAASMGALRAAELHRYGMAGVGQVFAAYRDGILTADDDVAVAYDPDTYTPLSTAMVDIRCTLEAAAAAGALSSQEAQQLAAALKALHYPARTWAMMRASAPAGLQPAAARFRQWAAASGGARSQKAADAREALSLAARGALPRSVPGCWAEGGGWQSILLRDWLARFRNSTTDGTSVPFELMLRHQQVHDPGFPRRWRALVMSWLPGGRDGGEAGAIEAAESAGISAGRLMPGQEAYWLTRHEAACLPEREKLARILVRSMSRDMTARIWPTSPAEAGPLVDLTLGSGEAAAAALRLNHAVATGGPQRTIWHLRAELVDQYLAALWGTGADRRALTAAARDRGFSSAGEAADCARQFYLLASPAAAR